MRRQLQAAAAQRAAPRALLADSRLLLPLPRSRDPITVGGSYPTVTTTAMESDVQSRNPPSLRQGPRNEGIGCVLTVGEGGGGGLTRLSPSWLVEMGPSCYRSFSCD